jgi:hypothetical protein
MAGDGHGYLRVGVLTVNFGQTNKRYKLKGICTLSLKNENLSNIGQTNYDVYQGTPS